MADINSMKERINELAESFDKVAETVKNPELTGEQFKQSVQKEMVLFLMYLAASDRIINTEEIDFMNALFDLEMSDQEYVDFINENAIYSAGFEENPPLPLKKALRCDARMLQVSESRREGYKLISPQLIEFYMQVGKEFVLCDGSIDEQELKDLNTYIYKMIKAVSKFAKEGPEYKVVNDDMGFLGPKILSNSKKLHVLPPRTEGVEVKSEYEESDYLIGRDMPSGRYKLFSNDERGYYCISRDANQKEIVCNDSFDSQAYIRVINKQYLELRRCVAVPFDQAPMFKGVIYSPGEYLVGTEIPPGEYEVKAGEDGRGYYCISSYGNNVKREIINNGSFNNRTYIEIKDGQVLELRRCTLEL